eukprot:TRINITY_DN3434_c0_g1_i1.p1 TRINITY_DN3434_c0_g1~~TRINITY_DN3434_c0_g1_i1.p1  ORF type:complete len:326 (+),score=52.32 TRINITY_DN3434_c0_g1_i1:40-1017(+)
METTINQIRSQCERLQKRAEDELAEVESQKKSLEEEKRLFDETTKKLEKYHSSDKVKFNVGGTHFTTTVSTLELAEPSFFTSIVSKRHNLKPEEDGSIFIDRNPTYFSYILDYLRTGKLLIPKKDHIREAVLIEAEFYNLEGIVQLLGKKSALDCTRDSLILRGDEKLQIEKWLGRPIKWKLLYRGSRDGFKGRDFHQHCNQKGPTVTVIKSSEYVFGGFIASNWSSGNISISDPSKTSFLFTLRNPHIFTAKFPLSANRSGDAASGHGSTGPTFGSCRNDLQVNDNCSGDVCFPSCYTDSWGYGNATFTGSSSFLVTELEVFGV